MYKFQGNCPFWMCVRLANSSKGMCPEQFHFRCLTIPKGRRWVHFTSKSVKYRRSSVGRGDSDAELHRYRGTAGLADGAAPGSRTRVERPPRRGLAGLHVAWRRAASAAFVCYSVAAASAFGRRASFSWSCLIHSAWDPGATVFPGSTSRLSSDITAAFCPPRRTVSPPACWREQARIRSDGRPSKARAR